MVAAIAAWRTMTGIRRTNASDTLEVIVETYTDLNPAGEDGIDRVDFTTVVNGGAPAVTSVTTKSLVEPNYSLSQSPIPGAGLGKLSRVWAYKITLDCNALAQGTIVVTANVVSGLGTVTAVDWPTSSITLYNDKGAADSRPNTGLVYWSGELGSDSNDGLSIVTPKKNLRNILETFGPDVGGLDIVALPGLNLVGGESGGGVDFFTSGHWWCNVICAAGARFRGYPTYPQFIIAPCQSTSGEFRIRFWGDSQFWEDDGFSFFVTSGRRCHAWIDGGYSQSANYDPAKPWTVLYANRNEGRNMVGQDGDVANSYKYCTSHTRRGITFGFGSWQFLQDVRIHDFTGVALQPASPSTRDTICNLMVDRHRYAQNDILGYIRANVGGLSTVSVPSAGVMRLTATGTLTNLPLGETCTLHGQCTELVGASNWSLLFSGLAAGNNGNFPVVGVGTNFVDVSNPSAVPGAVGAGATITTCTSSGVIYETLIHTDVLQALGVRTGCLWSGIRTEDMRGLRGIVDSGSSLVRCALVNCTSAAADNNDDQGATWVDCVVSHNNFNRWTTGAWVNCSVTDNVCDTAVNFPSTGFLRNNHFIFGSTGGTNPSAGPWYISDPAADPWSLQPSDPDAHADSGFLPGPPEWRWPNASGNARGVWNIAGTGPGNIDVTAFGLDFEGPITITPPQGDVVADVTATANVWGNQIILIPPEGNASNGDVPVVPPPSQSASGGGKTNALQAYNRMRSIEAEKRERDKMLRASVRTIEYKKL